jgi:1-acyl-sn-glycerol-3-phosphate acyltransferase
MDAIEKKRITPLLIFPEGTVTSGKHLLKFKKGILFIIFINRCVS